MTMIPQKLLVVTVQSAVQKTLDSYIDETSPPQKTNEARGREYTPTNGGGDCYTPPEAEGINVSYTPETKGTGISYTSDTDIIDFMDVHWKS
jgi:hypothetical protein